MKRSLQEYVELVVFGLIALLVGTGLLWLLGWVLSLGGIVLKGLAGLLWMLLRFVVPVAIAGGLVYFLVKAAQDRQKPAPAVAGGGAPAPGVIDVAPAAEATHAAQRVGDSVAASAGDVADAVPEEVEPVIGDAAVDVEAAADEASDAVDEASGALTEDEDEDTNA